MAPPPPRPPIICYDLQTSTNNTYKVRQPPSARYSLSARQNYSQKVKYEAEQRDKRKGYMRRKLAMQAQLEEINAQLDSVKRNCDYLLKTFGMSHNTAKYIQRYDEDLCKLKRKVEQFSETRSSELSRRIQQMKHFHELQANEDRKAEEKRSKDVSKVLHCRQNLVNTQLNSSTSSNPLSSRDANNTANSSSSTVSISSCSSPMFVESSPPPAFLSHKIRNSPVSSSPPSSSTPSRKEVAQEVSHKPAGFKFYTGPSDNETIEVEDQDFFEKVEDQTMLEVNKLVGRLRSELNKFSALT